MSKYIETKVRSEKMQEYGLTKKVTEVYLVDAMTFGEAENNAVAELAPFISGEFSVEAVKKSNIAEIFKLDNGDEKLYKVRCDFITLDEKSAKEKRQANYYIVEEADIKKALKRFEECMKGTLADYEIVSIAETPIIGIIEHDSNSSSD